MNERLTTRDLSEFLARQAGLDQKRAEKFIEVLSSYISQGIEKNKIVKLQGLGTFKIILVRERESVHIQTGERFVIPAHHKLSFVPDKDFKEQINRPFSFFEPIETTEEKIPKKVTFEKIRAEEKIADNIVNKQEETTIPVVVPDVVDEYEMPSTMADEYEVPVAVADEYEVPADIAVEHEVPEAMADEYEIPAAVVDEYEVPAVVADEHEIPAAVADEPEMPAVVADEYELLKPEPVIEYAKAESKKTDVDSGYKANAIKRKKKKKTVQLWLWFLLLPLLVIVGSGIALYAFLYYNSNRIPTSENVLIISEHNLGTSGISSPMPIGFNPILEGNMEGTGEYELIDEFLPDSVATETEVGEEEFHSETNTSDIKEEKKVIDWLAPSSEKSNTGTKRADKPNEKIESKNRELAASDTKKTTSAGNNTTTKTATESSERIVPSRVRMNAGSSLTQIAMEYYGDKVFWVYIYEYNKSRIKNFDNIPVGTEIRLPLPRTYGINAKSKSSVDKAKQKQAQLLKWDK